MARILLQGGLIVDGSGGPSWLGDVLIEGGRIVQLGAGLQARDPDPATQVLDCRGQVIAPGFIDAHTHDDALVLQHPQALPKLSQGITTVVAGNCGISLAPYATERAGPPLSLLGASSFQYASFEGYAAAVRAAQPALNVAALVGHTTLRYACVSELSRPANEGELAAMCALLDASLAAGAIGLSSGLFYEEAFAAPASEVVTLARVVARHGDVYTSHLRSEMATIIEIGRAHV